jgi:hypothetical protein
MKKIIALLTLFFAFTFNVSAQEKANVTELAKNDVVALAKVVKLTQQDETNFMGLFKKKHEVLSQANLSEDRRKIVVKSIDAKLRATLTADQMAKVDANPELLKQLTQN